MYEYSALLRRVGPWSERMGAAAMVFATFTSNLAYCIIIPQFLQPAFSEMFGILCGEYMYILVISPLILYPLCLLRDLKSLRFSSILGISAVLYCLALLLYESVHYHKLDRGPGTLSDPNAKFEKSHWTLGIFILVNIAAGSANCLFVIPSLYGALRNRSIQRMWIVLTVSHSIILVICVVFGVCGYYLFGSSAEANVLDNFHNEAGIAVAVARLAITLSIFGSFPLCFKAGLNVLEFQFFSEADSQWNFQENPRIRVVVITAILMMLTFGSLLLTDIGPVTSIQGAVQILLIICAFPIILYWKVRFGGRSGTKDSVAGNQISVEMMNYRKMEDVENVTHGMPPDSSSNDNLQKIGLCVLFVIGIGVGLAGFAASTLILAKAPLNCIL